MTAWRSTHLYIYIEGNSSCSKNVPLRYQKQRFLPHQKVIKWPNKPKMWLVWPHFGEQIPQFEVIFGVWQDFQGRGRWLMWRQGSSFYRMSE
jgi:hypothetical protein